MADATAKVLEGVFAVNKPPSLSSAQVLRDLQGIFAKSKTFAPLLEQTQAPHAGSNRDNKRRRIDPNSVFKMGHGGTLDPLATGTLIVGIGRGTKHLQSFLGCTKTYETVVLFGKETDTYDIAGKIVAEAPHDHITQALVEKKLSAFRGDIKQVPPIYSALKINGMKAYEYARSGKELPRQLDSRDMNVSECTLMDWFEPGKHSFKWPAQEATDEDKAAAQKLINKTLETAQPQSPTREEENEAGFQTAPSTPKSPALGRASPEAELKAAKHTHEIEGLAEHPADAPAARVRLTVSSGFYVRSFAHDLGLACRSHGTMAELDRSRQGDYTTQVNSQDDLVQALTYEDLDLGEEHWGPKLTAILEAWIEKHPESSSDQTPSSRDRRDRFRNSRDSNRHYDGPSRSDRSRSDKMNPRNRYEENKRRRNSSSPER